MAAALSTTAISGTTLGTAAALAPGDGPLPTLSLLLAADQASERVLVLDPNDGSWPTAEGGPQQRSARQAALWSWAPADDGGLGHLAPERTWRLISEAKYRVLGGRQWLLTCASSGLAAVVSYPAGRARWSTAASGNLHTMELLPDGNVAIAASDGGFVRVYTASQGPRSARYAQFDLPMAHGLQWDAARGLLWAVGYNQLVALDVGGSPADPELTAVRVVDLPDPDGHDLSAVADDVDQLWVTTGYRVHRYSVADAAFVRYPGQRCIDRPEVKSIGDDPVTGQVLTASPATGNPCTWCTSTIEFHSPSGSRRIQGANLYKARWMPRAPFVWPGAGPWFTAGLF